MKMNGYTENTEMNPYYEAKVTKNIVFEKCDIHIEFIIGDDIGTIDEIHILTY